MKNPCKSPIPGAEVLALDLRRPQHCARAVKGMDYVFLCAAHTSGAAVIRTTPLVHITPNVLINTLMLEAAHRAKVAKFCFISSGAAYPPTADRPVREAEMFDGDPHDVYFAAGWMKRYAEILCRTYAEKIAQPMPTVVVRPSNVYGPYDKFDFAVSHVTAALIRRVVERQNPLEVWGTGEDIRDLIYVDDFIEGLLAAFAADQPYLAVNICSGTGHSVRRDPAQDPGRRSLRQRQRPLRSLSAQHHPGAADGRWHRPPAARLQGPHAARHGAAPHHSLVQDANPR